MGLYNKISMLKNQWEDFSKIKLAVKLIKIVKRISKTSKAFRITINLKCQTSENT